MRDEERIDLFYRSGTMDWKSEQALANKVSKKTDILGNSNGFVLVKLCSLMISGFSTLTRRP
ncbi:MAG: hypothetical protein ACYC4E_02685 [Carboxydocellales bacterium]